MKAIKKIQIGLRWLFQVIGTSAVRFYWDDCFSRASSLAYTTLLALVPVSALSFSMLNAFRVEREQLVKTVSGILGQVLPPMENDLLKDLHAQVFNYLNLFNENVSALNTLSITILFLTAVALLNTIESAMNVVWRASSSLSIGGKIISFWAVITLGPLLIAASFYWWAKVGALAQSDPWFESNIFRFIDFTIPVVCTFFALTLLFYRLPAARVPLADATIGALLASIIFELVKRGFAYYISHSATYGTIYGVLTSIPVFLFWIYCAWVVVLFGAEVSYQVGNIRLFKGMRKYKSDLGELGGIFALRVLCCIARNFLSGDTPPSESELAIETGADPERIKGCLEILTQAGILTTADNRTHARTLIMSPDKLTVGSILETFRSENFENSKFSGRHGTPQNIFSDSFLEVLRRASLQAPQGAQLTSLTLSFIVTSGESVQGTESS